MPNFLENSRADNDQNDSELTFEQVEKSFINSLKSILQKNPKAKESFFAKKSDTYLKDVFDKDRNVKKKYKRWVKKEAKTLYEAKKFLRKL